MDDFDTFLGSHKEQAPSHWAKSFIRSDISGFGKAGDSNRHRLHWDMKPLY